MAAMVFEGEETLDAMLNKMAMRWEKSVRTRRCATPARRRVGKFAGRSLRKRQSWRLRVEGGREEARAS